ncbi:sulfotransferase family 2 domain-containing protein [Paenibacillus aquistagni]|uniref:sulfotransferase family 2 domain-containing protein n=1 Tax=Paenibacillus aquistagni TaxID=1852522 RepID=UPI000B506E0F|nr:sulfotransferase family 2 domain-containing protein [Paenibacillus aquistagni]
MNDSILVFVHIPKTGGVSLFTYLSPHFKKEEIAVFTPIVPKHDILDIVHMCNAPNSNIRFIEGHLPYGIHRHLNRPCEYITFVRDPIEQLLSMYFFIRRNEEMPLHDEVNQITFQQFLMHPDWKELNNNPQCRYLGLTQTFGESVSDPSNWWSPGSTFRNTYLVKQFLREQYRFIGITEYMDVSIKELARMFKWAAPADIPHENRAHKRYSRSQLSPETHSLIRERCSLDLKLYEYALQLFYERYHVR